MVESRRYEELLDEDLKNPAEAEGYLNACLDDGDPDVFLLALRDVARARGNDQAESGAPIPNAI